MGENPQTSKQTNQYYNKDNTNKMTKKKEMDSLIARYKADIAALEDRREDLTRHVEILENLIPTVKVWYMWKMFQSIEPPYSQTTPFPQHEIEKAKEHLAHLESVLSELQQAVELIEEEEEIMRKRVEELETLSNQTEKKPDRIDYKAAPTPQKSDKSEKSAKENLEVESSKEKEGKFEDNTDWKTVCKDLIKKVGELSENLKTSSQKLKESESHARYLENEYSRLERLLQEKIKQLESKSDTFGPASEISDKRKENYLQDELESKEAVSAMKEALSEVRSMKESLSRSKTSTKVDPDKPMDDVSQEAWSQKTLSDISIHHDTTQASDKPTTSGRVVAPKEMVGSKITIPEKVKDDLSLPGSSISSGNEQISHKTKKTSGGVTTAREASKDMLPTSKLTVVPDAEQISHKTKTTSENVFPLSEKPPSENTDLFPTSKIQVDPEPENIYDKAETTSKGKVALAETLAPKDIVSAKGQTSVSELSEGQDTIHISHRAKDIVPPLEKIASKSVIPQKSEGRLPTSQTSIGNRSVKFSDKIKISSSSIATPSDGLTSEQSKYFAATSFDYQKPPAHAKPKTTSSGEKGSESIGGVSENIASQDKIRLPAVSKDVNTYIVKTKEIDLLVSRYNSDIRALEERKEQLLRQVKITENLIPTVFLWYMSKVYQNIEIPFKQGWESFPEQEILEEAREKFEGLRNELDELQQAVQLIEKEENLMRERIEELEKCSSDQLDKYSDKVVDISKPVVAQKKDYGDIKAKKSYVKREESKDQFLVEDTNWKKLCEDLIQKVKKLRDNLKNASQQLRESEDYAKHLEEEYSKVEEELQEKIQLLKKKTDISTPEDKQEEREAKEVLSTMQEALAEVKSMKESLSKSTIMSKVKPADSKEDKPPIPKPSLETAKLSEDQILETKKSIGSKILSGALPTTEGQIVEPDTTTSKKGIFEKPEVQKSETETVALPVIKQTSAKSVAPKESKPTPSEATHSQDFITESKKDGTSLSEIIPSKVISSKEGGPTVSKATKESKPASSDDTVSKEVSLGPSKEGEEPLQPEKIPPEVGSTIEDIPIDSTKESKPAIPKVTESKEVSLGPRKAGEEANQPELVPSEVGSTTENIQTTDLIATKESKAVSSDVEASEEVNLRPGKEGEELAQPEKIPSEAVSTTKDSHTVSIAIKESKPASSDVTVSKEVSLGPRKESEELLQPEKIPPEVGSYKEDIPTDSIATKESKPTIPKVAESKEVSLGPGKEGGEAIQPELVPSEVGSTTENIQTTDSIAAKDSKAVSSDVKASEEVNLRPGKDGEELVQPEIIPSEIVSTKKDSHTVSIAIKESKPASSDVTVSKEVSLGPRKEGEEPVQPKKFPPEIGSTTEDIPPDSVATKESKPATPKVTESKEVSLGPVKESDAAQSEKSITSGPTTEIIPTDSVATKKSKPLSETTMAKEAVSATEKEGGVPESVVSEPENPQVPSEAVPSTENIPTDSTTTKEIKPASQEVIVQKEAGVELDKGEKLPESEKPGVFESNEIPSEPTTENIPTDSTTTKEIKPSLQEVPKKAGVELDKGEKILESEKPGVSESNVIPSEAVPTTEDIPADSAAVKEIKPVLNEAVVPKEAGVEPDKEKQLPESEKSGVSESNEITSEAVPTTEDIPADSVAIKEIKPALNEAIVPKEAGVVLDKGEKIPESEKPGVSESNEITSEAVPTTEEIPADSAAIKEINPVLIEAVVPKEAGVEPDKEKKLPESEKPGVSESNEIISEAVPTTEDIPADSVAITEIKPASHEAIVPKEPEKEGKLPKSEKPGVFEPEKAPSEAVPATEVMPTGSVTTETKSALPEATVPKEVSLESDKKDKLSESGKVLSEVIPGSVVTKENRAASHEVMKPEAFENELSSKTPTASPIEKEPRVADKTQTSKVEKPSKSDSSPELKKVESPLQDTTPAQALSSEKDSIPPTKKPSPPNVAAQTLQGKLLVKDHLIKSMADQLRDLARSNKWPGRNTFEAATSTDPVKTYDFDKNTLLQYLKGQEPKGFAESMKSNEKYSSSNPLNVKIIRKVDKDSLMIEWGPLPSAEVAGFQIFVNGQFMYWVHSAKRNIALIQPLDLKVLLEIAVSPVTERGNIITRSSVTYKPE